MLPYQYEGEGGRDGCDGFSSGAVYFVWLFYFAFLVQALEMEMMMFMRILRTIVADGVMVRKGLTKQTIPATWNIQYARNDCGPSETWPWWL